MNSRSRTQHVVNRVIASGLPLLTLGENRLSILIFHRVLESYDFMRPDEITADEFDKKMELIKKYFTPLPLNEAIDRLKEGSLPKRAICITFDDGYRDNAEVAYPILKKWNIPATFFIATGFLNDGRMWNDTVIETIRVCSKNELDLSKLGLGLFKLGTRQQREQSAQKIIQNIKHCPQDERAKMVEAIASHASLLPNNLMMEAKQVAMLSENGMEIGGHTVTHPILATLSADKVEQEIAQGKTTLENLIQRPVTSFAYPNGKPGQDYLLEHADIVKQLGFKAAVSTKWGVSDSKTDRFQLNRFTPWDKSESKFMLRLSMNLLNVS